MGLCLACHSLSYIPVVELLSCQLLCAVTHFVSGETKCVTHFVSGEGRILLHQISTIQSLHAISACSSIPKNQHGGPCNAFMFAELHTAILQK